MTQRIRGNCQFCGQYRDLTREDLIPKWAARYLRELGNTGDVLLSIRVRDLDTQSGLFNKRKKLGSFSAFKIPIVCGECNNGWMSSLEDGVRPIIEPMVAGLRTELTIKDQELLGSWLTLKLYTFDRLKLHPALEKSVSTSEQSVVSDYEMKCFFAQPSPPKEFFARVGRLSNYGSNQVIFEIARKTTGPDLLELPQGTPASCEFRFSLGPVLFHCMFTNSESSRYYLPQIDIVPQPYWSIFFPAVTTQQWPPPYPIDFNDLELSKGGWYNPVRYAD